MQRVGDGLLLSGRGSGVTSPRRMAHSGCRRSTKVMNRERLIFPAGTRSTRMRAGAMGEKGSTAMVTSGVTQARRR